MEELSLRRSPWPERRRRAAQLRERQPFAAEVLTLFLALLDVQEPAFERASGRPPGPEEAPGLARGLLAPVIDATMAAGPALLAEAAVGRFHSADLDDVVGRWLRGAEQSAVDRYLARAACAPILEAMEPDALAVLCSSSPSPPEGEGRGGGVESMADDRSDPAAPDDPPHPNPPPPGGRERRAGCPRCEGPPQLGFFSLSGEALVTGPRHLVCARCGADWVHARMVCAGCGEETASRLPVYSEAEQFPHLRIDGCETCRRYLIMVDLRRDAAAVPVVDELAALPLDLYAKERGLSKVVPNLMGF
jgi:ribosomal protein L37E